MRLGQLTLLAVVFAACHSFSSQDTNAGIFDQRDDRETPLRQSRSAEEVNPHTPHLASPRRAQIEPTRTAQSYDDLQLGSAQGWTPEQISYLQPEALPAPADLVGPVLPCGDHGICYIYRQWRSSRWACSPTYQTILPVTIPCSGDCCTPPALLELPICLPCCCEGVPTVDCRCGPLGRGVVKYRWCCGYEVRIVFSRCGDITVISNAL